MKKEKKSSAAVILRIVKDAVPILPRISLAAAIRILSVLLAMIAPELLGRLTDIVYGRISDGAAIVMNEFFSVLLVLALVYVISCVLDVLTTFIMNHTVTRHFTCRIRTEMSRKISSVPIKLTDSTPNGEIISKMTHDVSMMGGSIHDIFSVAINGVIKLVIISIVIFIQNWQLALAIVVFVPLSMLLSARLAKRSEEHFTESRTAAGKLYSICEENLTGFDTVKVFSLEGHQQKRYEAVCSDYAAKSQKGYYASGIVQPIVALVNNLAYVAICLIGGYLAITDSIGVGELVAFIMYTKLFSGPLESIAGGMATIQSTVASARRVYDFLDSEQMSECDAAAPREPRGEVVFENVSFSYTEGKPLIESLSLTARAGQKVAIVGPTGSGKTTLVNLLMRFYDPCEGRILVDGVDTATVSRESVRDMFGMVLQDTFLFSGTVHDNIAYGVPDATREEVIRAARRAHIDGFIESLPQGYETLINEDSTNISQGQKQLITIARAYLANRPILILDEATSNVDTRTELLIQKTMDELMRERTAFVIAHRLSTIKNADIILVVDNGRIVERGTHGELLMNDGLYSQMYKSQYQRV